jgi:hypothetical protein
MRRGATVGEQNRTHEVIRQCGGIVHSDGNIFFTNRYQFEHAASILLGVATVRVESAASPASATKEREPVAWLRNDEMKAMPADEKAAWIEAGRLDIVADYTVPLYASPVATQGDAKRLHELIDTYWCLAYAEGKEGREQDTEDGAAQNCRGEIDAILRAMSPIQGEKEKPEQPNVHLADDCRTARKC